MHTRKGQLAQQASSELAASADRIGAYQPADYGSGLIEAGECLSEPFSDADLRPGVGPLRSTSREQEAYAGNHKSSQQQAEAAYQPHLSSPAAPPESPSKQSVQALAALADLGLDEAESYPQEGPGCTGPVGSIQRRTSSASASTSGRESDWDLDIDQLSVPSGQHCSYRANFPSAHATRRAFAQDVADDMPDADACRRVDYPQLRRQQVGGRAPPSLPQARRSASAPRHHSRCRQPRPAWNHSAKPPAPPLLPWRDLPPDLQRPAPFEATLRTSDPGSESDGADSPARPALQAEATFQEAEAGPAAPEQSAYERAAAATRAVTLMLSRQPSPDCFSTYSGNRSPSPSPSPQGPQVRRVPKSAGSPDRPLGPLRGKRSQCRPATAQARRHGEPDGRSEQHSRPGSRARYTRRSASLEKLGQAGSSSPGQPKPSRAGGPVRCWHACRSPTQQMCRGRSPRQQARRSRSPSPTRQHIGLAHALTNAGIPQHNPQNHETWRGPARHTLQSKAHAAQLRAQQEATAAMLAEAAASHAALRPPPKSPRAVSPGLARPHPAGSKVWTITAPAAQPPAAKQPRAHAGSSAGTAQAQRRRPQLPAAAANCSYAPASTAKHTLTLRLAAAPVNAADGNNSAFQSAGPARPSSACAPLDSRTLADISPNRPSRPTTAQVHSPPEKVTCAAASLQPAAQRTHAKQTADPEFDPKAWRQAPALRFQLSTPQPAVHAGPWEEEATRAWLTSLGLHICPDNEKAPLLENKLRNGVLLCLLTGLLEGQHHLRPFFQPQPKDLGTARTNFMGALHVLGMLCQPAAHAQLAATQLHTHQSSSPYTSPAGRRPASADPAEAVSGSQEPDGPALGLRWEVERMLQGQRASIWGLLNHLRLTHPNAQLASTPGACSRAAWPGGGGSDTHLHTQCSSQAAGGSAEAGGHFAARPDLADWEVPEPGTHQQQQRRQPQPSSLDSPRRPHHRLAVVSAASPRQLAVALHWLASPDYKRQVDACRATLQFAGQPRCVDPHSLRSGAEASPLRKRHPSRAPQLSSPQCQPDEAVRVASPRRAAACSTAVEAADTLPQSQRKGLSGPAKPACSSPKPLMLEKPIEQWLGLKGISLPPGTPLEDAFADGRLLCTLVRTLSGRSMTGVEWRQPNRASGLHNISVAMQRLKDCPNMAIDMLWRGKDIANCHPTALRSLLADMRAAFG